MKPTMEIKKRYKMYKKGKYWVCAAILFAGATGVMSVTTQAYADELPSPSGTESVITTPELDKAVAEAQKDPNITRTILRFITCFFLCVKSCFGIRLFRNTVR